ncbi:MAG: ABC transporter ATP-binding protein [Hyphomicrobiaceae bacterium]|nr:ABC transporter ATP-binding protein [Hyphomicrobiaceae bacterium]
MTEPVITVNNVSLSYSIYDKPIDMLKEALFGRVYHDSFWALRNITLQVGEGERIGIIGPNGAGKSTLLQIIAGVLKPTSGDVTVDGKIYSLLSLVPAWNANDSGLENIKFNLQLKGADARKIPEIIEDIIDFTDLGPFIYQPVKTYSAGMSARLSFAIATALDPEILIVDEVLGAGDGYFAGRAARRMKEMCNRGKALLFVSHDVSAVRSMCTSCIWIENGEIRKRGPVETVVRAYEEDMMRQQDETLREGNRRRREAMRGKLLFEDIDEADLMRIRIRAKNKNPRITETHYVHDIAIEVDDRKIEVPLGMVDLREEGIEASLDLESCEWGRLYDLEGRRSRLLLPRTGSKDGGHILLKRPRNPNGTTCSVKLTLSVTSLGEQEVLTADFVNQSKKKWQLLDTVLETKNREGVNKIEFYGEVELPTKETAEKISKELRSRSEEKPVEITDVAILSDGRPVISVDELKPFDVVIKANIKHQLDGVNFGINIIRSDGAYVFYQPSGMNDRNVRDYVGDVEVRFRFDPNPFGAGDYELNVFATNSFDWNNCPPSDVYDRRIAAALFKVNLTRPISFGLLNAIVPVEIELLEKASPVRRRSSIVAK